LILLDTNVVSELWRPRPDPAVMGWLDRQPSASVYLCTPVLAELRFGAARLPTGLRKNVLNASIDLLESHGYRDRILPFDLPSAATFGQLAAKRERIGRRIEPMDGMIAAIAVSHRATLATRDIGDFAELGLDLINPFDASIVP
jgi:predicted nucleic acid-binding protein